MSYTAPIKDLLFTMREVAGLAEVQQLPGHEDATDETLVAVLEENAKFCQEVVAPLNWTSDIKPSRWHAGPITNWAGQTVGHVEVVA